jgi:quercetin dioxygenase-like cupin family protein
MTYRSHTIRERFLAAAHIGRRALVPTLLVAGLISGVSAHAAVSRVNAGAANSSCAAASRAKPIAPLTAFHANALPAGSAMGVPTYASFPAGFTLKHVHGGPTYVYVISGDFTISDSHGTITYCAGSFFSEAPGHVHTLHVITPTEVFILAFLPPGADATIPVQ